MPEDELHLRTVPLRVQEFPPNVLFCIGMHSQVADIAVESAIGPAAQDADQGLI